MKILIVSQQPDALNYVRSLVAGSASFVVQYTHPLKAMDNLEELAPDLILWDAMDFPRHWKICLLFCRADAELSKLRFVLVSAETLPEEEAKKARAMAVDGVIEDGFFSDSLPSLIGNTGPTQVRDAEVKIDTGIGDTPVRHAHVPKGDSILIFHPADQDIIRAVLSGADELSVSAVFADSKDALAFNPGMIVERSKISGNEGVFDAILKVLDVEGFTVRFGIMKSSAVR